jgi:IMP dehydrogenase/GMP reductase
MGVAMKLEQAFTFDDVLIKPNYSTIVSRADVDLTTKIGRYTILKLPIIAANMTDLVGEEMVRAMAKVGAIACLPRFMTVEANVAWMRSLIANNVHHWVSCGIGEQEQVRLNHLVYHGANVVVIDVAHANTSMAQEFYERNRDRFPEVDFILGNTIEWPNWLDGDAILKVGIGPGATCTTRVKTGCGFPQFSAIVQSSVIGTTIADGGCKTPGDIAKALGAGANAVMLGSMLAKTDAAANSQFFGGSASEHAYGVQGKLAKHRTAEGKRFSKGVVLSFEEVIQDIEGGLRSAFSYVGARNLTEFHNRVRFVQVTSAGLQEGHAHFNG